MDSAQNLSHSNYYLPSEWHTQQAIQITWPHHNTPWQLSNSVEKIDAYFVNLASAILQYQDLIISADSEELKKQITNKLSGIEHNYNYYIYVTKTNDTWARDNSVITIIDKLNNNQKLLLDFEFNAWGAKYSFEHDNLVTNNLYNQNAYLFKHSPGQLNFKQIDYILEGGAIDSNGQGCVLTTSSVIFNPNRNHQHTDQQIIDSLKKDLNIDNLIIFENSFLAGDDTDGHIDQLVRFCSEDTIAYAACDNPLNPNYESLKKLEQEVFAVKNNNAICPNLKTIPLYIPNAITDENNNILPASYCNFLIINNAVLVPIYGDAVYDQKALDNFKQIFQDRDIIGLNSKAVIRHGGSLHCLTMQIPA